jgi:hypothetical protein
MNDTTTTILTESAWALQNKLNPFPVAGTLQWDGETLSFTLGRMAGEAVLGWVEKRLDQTDLITRLRGGEDVTAFAWPTGTFTTNWPAMYAGGTVEVTGPSGTTWLIALDYPSGGAISQSLSLFTGRRKAKAWKAALPS